jgi:hypothetical protein
MDTGTDTDTNTDLGSWHWLDLGMNLGAAQT